MQTKFVRSLSLSLAPLALVACATSTPRAPQAVEAAQLESALPAPAPAASLAQPAAPRAQQPAAPKEAMLTAGIGVSDSPVSTLFSASYDVPIDDHITLGPSFHYGYDDDVDLFGAEAKGRYFLAPFTETVQAYVSAGGGFGMVDKNNRSEDWGLLFSGGAGLRVKTSTHGMLSSEVNFYWLPEDLAGEDHYFGWQIVQFVIAF
jgi:hypothetical protein